MADRKLKSIIGPPGPPGKSIQSGIGPPSDSIGNNDDFYIDLATYRLYGPREGGEWPTSSFPLGGGDPLLSGVKIEWMIKSMRALDKEMSISYFNLGTLQQVIEKVTYSSSNDPDVLVVKDFFYLDIATRLQRIDKVEYTGNIFGGDSLRKNYIYSPDGVRLGYNYEVF